MATFQLFSAASLNLGRSHNAVLGNGLINPLPNDKILDQSKLKAFADNKINVTEKLKFILERVEHFLFFPTMLSIGFRVKVVKSRDCVVKS